MSLAYRSITAAIARLSRLARLTNVQTHTFYAGGLSPSSVVVDLGANVGEFAGEMSRRFRCRCLAIEAVPELCAAIPRRAGIEVFNVAIADFNGPITVHLSDDRAGNSIQRSIATEHGYRGAVTCAGVTLERLLEREGLTEVDLLKVDIEGAEARMFASTPDAILRRAHQVSIEFHDHVRDGISTEEVDAIVERMARLGFECLRFSSPHPRTRNADVLFIQPRPARVRFKDRFLFATIKWLLRLQDEKARVTLRLPPTSTAELG